MLPDDDMTLPLGTARADIASLSRGLADASQSGALLGRSLAQAFDGLLVKGRSLSDTFNGVALSLSQSVLKAAFQPLQTGLANVVTGLLGGASPLAFARGGVLRQGTPVPFAQGGVIAAPVTFPLGERRMGLAGEAGPEAILPLRRGRDGRLGVAMAGAGAATASINVTIHAADIDSFRRSETQVAALLARAVARGARNL
jgi:phage-related minor tail protein